MYVEILIAVCYNGLLIVLPCLSVGFFNRDWVSPVIQVTTNAMVSFLEIKDRSAALTNIKELISKLAVDDR